MMQLIERIERLEKQNRQLKISMFSFIGLATILVCIGAANQDQIVEAQEFRLVDALGNPRGKMEATPTGAWLHLFDSAGKTKVALYAAGDPGDSYGGISLKENGETQVEMTGGSGGGIRLRDRNGQERLTLQNHSEFGPMVRLIDTNKTERLRIGSDQNAAGKPFVWMFDQQFNRSKSIEP